MLDGMLIATLERLTPVERKAILAVAEYIEKRRATGENGAESLLAELREPRFSTPDEDLSPARQAARRFMRENPSLMRLLAQ